MLYGLIGIRKVMLQNKNGWLSDDFRSLINYLPYDVQGKKVLPWYNIPLYRSTVHPWLTGCTSKTSTAGWGDNLPCCRGSVGCGSTSPPPGRGRCLSLLTVAVLRGQACQCTVAPALHRSTPDSYTSEMRVSHFDGV